MLGQTVRGVALRVFVPAAFLQDQGFEHPLGDHDIEALFDHVFGEMLFSKAIDDFLLVYARVGCEVLQNDGAVHLFESRLFCQSVRFEQFSVDVLTERVEDVKAANPEGHSGQRRVPTRFLLCHVRNYTWIPRRCFAHDGVVPYRCETCIAAIDHHSLLGY
jgi:hypothetical protein